MTTPATPSAPKPAGDDRNLVAVDGNYIAPSFEDRVRMFWNKNRSLVLGALAVVFVAIVVKGGWEYYADQQEHEVEQAFAAAGTPEKLKAFIAAHPEHSLAGVAQLQLADQAYAAGKSADAVAGYGKAAALLKTGPLASRAQIGQAMAQLQAGKFAEGEAALKLVLADTKQPKAARAEAAYQLASRAYAQRQGGDVKKFTDQLMQIDPESGWMQRAMLLRASMPAETVAAPAMPVIAVPPAGKK